MIEPVEENIPLHGEYVYENEGYDNEETTTFTEPDPAHSSTPYAYD